LKILFDSSTIIAAIIEAHPKHEIAFSWLVRANEKEFELVVSAHSILEVYSVLTAAPFKPKISPLAAKKLIRINIERIATIQYLNSKDYLRLLESVSSLELHGGIVYDALIFECAKKSNVAKIATLNAKDFNRLNVENSIELVSL